jgi:hypothetical protein
MKRREEVASRDGNMMPKRRRNRRHRRLSNLGGKRLRNLEQ